MIIELLGLLKTFRRQKTAKMLKFCSKVKKVLNSAGNVKSAEKVPNAIGTCLMTVDSNFPWVLQSSQEKSKTMVMQNLGGRGK